MNETDWSLDALYPSFLSREFLEDQKKLKEKIAALKIWCQSHFNTTKNAEETLLEYLKIQNELGELSSRLYEFASLKLSTDTKDRQAARCLENIEKDLTKTAPLAAAFQKWLALLPSIPFSKEAKEHQFYLEELRKFYKHTLSEKEEEILSRLETTGSGAWEKMWDELTAGLMVPLSLEKEEVLPLSAVRNLAYDKNPAVRKEAYEKELQSYEGVAQYAAASLSAIKGEVLTVASLRGYSSVLEMTLQQSRMEEEILDAMIDAMKEALPAFRQYFLKKAALLGHDGPLPFYDLFAPLPAGYRNYTYEEAKKVIIEEFSAFSKELGEYAKKAFSNRWIDVYPKEGKRGGAFCSNLHSIKESRILTNFTGSFSDVITLAHELGHGYHGYCLEEETYLNSDYPMPIAETASTFCETLVKNALYQKAGKEEQLFILETDLADNAQIVVDILCRFLFEKEVFEKRKEGPLSKEDFCALMLKAQKETYGEGLLEGAMHPYMWLCKPHYYDAHYNFYNFPYAFGLLFSKGLFALYEKEKEFVPRYKNLLRQSGKKTMGELGEEMGISLKSPSFWQESLQVLKKEIDLFLEM